MERIREEIAKCDIYCANCHIKLHEEERRKRRVKTCPDCGKKTDWKGKWAVKPGTVVFECECGKTWETYINLGT